MTWRRALQCAGGAARRIISQPSRMIASRPFAAKASDNVDSMILRSLKDHYLEVTRMSPPPKVNPPSPYEVVKGAIDSGGPVLKRTFNDEEISVSVMRMGEIIPGGSAVFDNDINQLFVHVEISKPGQKVSLHFLCGMYPDAIGIHSCSLRPKEETSALLLAPSEYNGPIFEDLDEKFREAFHRFIEERGIDEGLFPFLQAWLYVKDHRDLLRWFKTVGTFVNNSHQESTKA